MRALPSIALAAAWLLAAPAHADWIVYSHESSGSGSLDGKTFEATDFTINAVAHSGDAVPMLPFMTYIPHVSASITIDGVGSFDFVSPTTTFAEHPGQWGAPAVAFGPLALTGPELEPFGALWGPLEQTFADWDTTTPVGPIEADAFHSAWHGFDIETTGGRLLFDDTAIGGISASFTAEMAPLMVPDSTDLSSSLIQGHSETQTLALANDGEADLDWQVVTAFDVNTPPIDDDSVTISQSHADEIQSGNSFSCSNDDGETTASTHFMRIFRLSDFGITDTFELSELSIGIEELTEAAEATINLYTLEGNLSTDNLDKIDSTTETLSAQALSMETVPLATTVPAGATLVVEVVTADLDGQGRFLPGSNDLGENGHSYFASDACGVSQPIPFMTIGVGDIHLVMEVTGTTSLPDCDQPQWLHVEPASGTVPGGSQTSMDVTFNATGLDTGTYASTLCLEGNDPAAPLQTIDLEMTVTELVDEIFHSRFEAD